MIPKTAGRLVDASDRKPARSVLVVDDVPEIGDLCRSVFRRIDGFEIRAHVAPSVERAVELLQSTPFHLVITDLRLRGGSGESVIAATRASQPGVPVILISAAPETFTAREHVSAVLTKPLDLALFATTIVGLLAGRVPAAPDMDEPGGPVRRFGGSRQFK